jgi:hypothetical protein
VVPVPVAFFSGPGPGNFFSGPGPGPDLFLYSLRYNIQGCSEVEKIRTVDDFFENF